MKLTLQLPNALKEMRVKLSALRVFFTDTGFKVPLGRKTVSLLGAAIALKDNGRIQRVRNASLLALLVILPSVQAAKLPADPEFVILITSYNNERFALRNLESVVKQRSKKPYEIIIIEDGSTDRTGKIMDEYVNEHKLDQTFIKIIHNKQRIGSALENIYNAVHELIPDHKVVVCVDGDDTLPHNGVLERLEQAYNDPDIWMTFGRFVVYPAGEFWSACWKYPAEVIRERSFRKCSNVPSHLKTFKAALFKKIKKEDLLYQGAFFKKAWDMAMLFPMLEMCAPHCSSTDAPCKNHSLFISDVLYVYNWDNQLSDGHTGRDEQIMLDRYVRAKEPYEPVDHL